MVGEWVTEMVMERLGGDSLVVELNELTDGMFTVADDGWWVASGDGDNPMVED